MILKNGMVTKMSKYKSDELTEFLKLLGETERAYAEFYELDDKTQNAILHEMDSLYVTCSERLNLHLNNIIKLCKEGKK